MKDLRRVLRLEIAEKLVKTVSSADFVPDTTGSYLGKERRARVCSWRSCRPSRDDFIRILNGRATAQDTTRPVVTVVIRGVDVAVHESRALGANPFYTAGMARDSWLPAKPLLRRWLHKTVCHRRVT
jgi:hypothetical protein